MSEFVTFKDLNAELSKYQRRVSYKSMMDDIEKMGPLERFALAGMLIATLKVILRGLL